MLNSPEAKQVYWHSRRGMLELDLLLVPFVEQEYEKLSEVEQQRYRELLRCEDTELFSWLLSRSQPARAELKEIVQRIVDYARKNPRPN